MVGLPLWELRAGSTSVVPAPSAALSTWSAVAEVLGYRLWRHLPGEPAWTQAGENTDLRLALTDQPTGVEIEPAVSAFNAEGNGPRSAPETITL